MINRTVILATLMTLALGACSTVEGVGTDLSRLFGTNNKPKESQAQAVFNGNSTDGENWVDTKGNPMVPPTKSVDLSYNRMAGEIVTTNDSVQMFSLDGPNPSQPLQKLDRRNVGTGSITLEPPSAGVPSSTDTSVTVFPFSNDMYTPGVKPGFNGYGRRPAQGFSAGGDNYAPIGGGIDALPLYAGNPDTIYFAHGSSALSATARQVIARVAQNYNGGMVTIDGHASHRTGTKDPVKSELINFQMSMKRAMGVMKKLMMSGVPAKALKVTAHGDAEPAAPETDRSAEKLNRRVEIRTRP